MSPRAAWRLESLGFGDVYEYTAGKADWLANALPREGMTAAIPYAGDVAHREAASCRLEEPLTSLVERVQASVHGFCLVLNDEGILLGRVPADALAHPLEEATAGDVMDPGPATIRANQPAEALGAWMRERNLHTMVVTGPQGSYIGVLRREDAEEAGEAGRSALARMG